MRLMLIGDGVRHDADGVVSGRARLANSRGTVFLYFRKGHGDERIRARLAAECQRSDGQWREIDADEEPYSAARLGVYGFPTVLVIVDGVERERHDASSLSTLLERTRVANDAGRAEGGSVAGDVAPPGAERPCVADRVAAAAARGKRGRGSEPPLRSGTPAPEVATKLPRRGRGPAEPVWTPLEILERAIVSHVIASDGGPTAQTTTRVLFRVYQERCREFGHRVKMLPAAQALALYRGHFAAGYRFALGKLFPGHFVEVSLWPSALPCDAELLYPASLIRQIATRMGSGAAWTVVDAVFKARRRSRWGSRSGSS